MRFLSERNEIGFVIIGGAKKSRFSSQGDRPPKTGHGRPNLGVDNMHYSREILLSPPVCDFLLVSRMMLLHTWADFELSTHGGGHGIRQPQIFVHFLEVKLHFLEVKLHFTEVKLHFLEVKLRFTEVNRRSFEWRPRFSAIA